MDFKRLIFTLYFLLFSSWVYSLPEPGGNLGIALVHGTKDHRDDAEGVYWKTDFIQSLTQALPNPENYYVVHCDFSKYMWDEDAAGCAADQLLNFIADKNISSLIVYTHSNGGNVIRWILSNPTYDSRYLQLKNKIDQVIALAPSSGGTPLADALLNGGVFEASLSWLLGYTGDAIKQQRIGDMYIYNEELLFGTKNRPSLPKPFKSVVGTDVIASPLNSSSYCNGYILNSGLKIAKLYLDSCADGFLNCSSQAVAGSIWFYDKDKLEDHLTLSHNQSRHSCFGLEKILTSVIDSEGAA
ncbi:hypothetical protein [Legionella longbeachae]|uniref:Lipase n=1 Tax=Legionella longbeachae serogroup 1 (strain NSW150) TaxID=661367 RepID=D3HIT7_LEGLN|nr:hypothetical protein [Legionella longbeachae]VEE02826.1 Uncharacterised protein [Legionella oakridgensis]HBD7398002.1 hypothetical protein [Legionella pneumophila]ARB90930.1 hypothetical protein A6J40_01390 [Legionella longbeachae]ARM32639.1 hypothetical protein B0B39_03520 [Legionella longbeachae]EEZ94586.1 conserved hypothetical protein [Legionella longbeachae D-4968]